MAARETLSSPSPVSSSGATVLDREDLECVVCFNEFSRTERMPRVLHCRHTFCIVCLDAIAKKEATLCTISCPLCRWITCTNVGLCLHSALPIDREIWDHIPMGQKEVERNAPEKVHKAVLSKRLKSLKKMFYCGPKMW